MANDDDAALARGSRLRTAREAKDLGVRELSRLAGLGGGPSDISKIENGKQPTPNYDKIKALAAVLDVTPEWLWSGEGPRERRPEQTVDLDGDLDPRIAEVGKALGAPAQVIRAAHDLRAARGTAGLTDEDIRGLLRSLAAADELAQLKAVGGLQRGALVEVADDDLQPRRKKK